MPRIGCSLDKMDWTKVKDMIQDVFHCSLVQVIVLTPPNVSKQHEAQANEPPQETQVAENNDSNPLQMTQQNDPSLKNYYQWMTSGTPSTNKELQGCPRSTWQMAN